MLYVCIESIGLRNVLERLACNLSHTIVGATNYLSDLSARSVVTDAIVSAIPGRYTRLIGRAAGIAANDVPARQPFNEAVEGVVGRDVLETLICMWFRESCSVGYYLGDLAPGSVIACAEVSFVIRR